MSIAPTVQGAMFLFQAGPKLNVKPPPSTRGRRMIVSTAESAERDKSPARVAAGRVNGSKRRPWTAKDRERLQRQCLVRKPWLRSTGPRTDAGKQRSALNGWSRVSDPDSRRSARAAVADVQLMMQEMAILRGSVFGE
jgi:hypothetical protein